MNSLQSVPEQQAPKISPEHLEVANDYLKHFSISETCRNLHLLEDHVLDILNKKEVKRYIDNVFLEHGYQNRFKLQNILDKIIDQKLEEALESGIYSKKDLVDILALVHKIRMEEVKNNKEGPSSQVNIQNNYGENYMDLMQKLMQL